MAGATYTGTVVELVSANDTSTSTLDASQSPKQFLVTRTKPQRSSNRLVRRAVPYDQIFPQFAKAAREIEQPKQAPKDEKRQLRRAVAKIEQAVEAVAIAYPALLNPALSDEIQAEFDAIVAQLEAALEAMLQQHAEEALRLSYLAFQAALAVQAFLDFEDEALVLLLMAA
ncbi:MAG: hypothetical protein M3R04_09340 [bacterium]|nr:hypothetical protein [bacterium]